MIAKDSKSDYQLRNDPIFANMSFYRGRSLISKKKSTDKLNISNQISNSVWISKQTESLF